ncbi:hypothetical protein Tco_0729391 [Tanacetum coccineum]|uniref:Uncharacterized protein n=1 Tax=Tanacetum coccineum TaxID=301880 RepID=A0ABQ4YR70_9ASTR
MIRLRYHFNSHKKIVSVARYAELFENSLKFTSSGSLTLQEVSGSNVSLELLQEEEYNKPSKRTSECHTEAKHEIGRVERWGKGKKRVEGRWWWVGRRDVVNFGEVCILLVLWKEEREGKEGRKPNSKIEKTGMTEEKKRRRAWKAKAHIGAQQGWRGEIFSLKDEALAREGDAQSSELVRGVCEARGVGRRETVAWVVVHGGYWAIWIGDATRDRGFSGERCSLWGGGAWAYTMGRCNGGVYLLWGGVGGVVLVG